MRIILKPLGVLVLVAALGALSYIAFRSRNAQGAGAPMAVNSGTKAPIATGATVPGVDGVIYDDGLQNGWTNFSWAKNDFADTKTVTSGRCIRVEAKKFEAVYFHHEPMSLAAYDRVTFRVNGGDTGGQQLKMMVQFDTNGKNSGGDEYILPALAPKKWSTITVPLTKLGAGGKPNVAGFWLQEAVGKTIPAYYVDDVRLLKPGEAVPAE